MQEALQRLMARVDQSGGEDACHLWTGAVDSNGYGCIKVDGKKHNTHRYLAMALGWDIEGKDVRHYVCHNRLCCNKRHLLPGTRAENMNDSRATGKFPPRGTRNGNAKLTEDAVRRIKQRGKKEHAAAIAAVYGVSRQVVAAILKGKAWTHV